ncbi:hypothetical protein QYE76_048266 [Lolium multiflorum]|uniref:Reverse transcriptase zinc-binding domain-containing protein n=1 Tax=Lolium multiflorum TaxID=4521 RepID=A0AAD8QBZ6_LOLMU|nr:hypothetical protein QYE76_048266 [Lolium multiflorum]
MALAVLKLVGPSTINHLKVGEGLLHHARVLHIASDLSVDASCNASRCGTPCGEGGVSYCDYADEFVWKWTADGEFRSKFAYRAFFHGTTALPGDAQVWISFAHVEFKFQAWFSLRRRCWMVGRWLRHRLSSHVMCPLCNVNDETSDHLVSTRQSEHRGP